MRCVRCGTALFAADGVSSVMAGLSVHILPVHRLPCPGREEAPEAIAPAPAGAVAGEEAPPPAVGLPEAVGAPEASRTIDGSEKCPEIPGPPSFREPKQEVSRKRHRRRFFRR